MENVDPPAEGEYIAEWALRLPIHMYRPYIRRVFYDNGVRTFRLRPNVQHIDVISTESEDLGSFTWPQSVPFVQWSTIRHHYRIDAPGSAMFFITFGALPNEFPLNIQGSRGSRQVALKLEEKNEVLSDYSNRYEPDIQTLLQADPSAPYQNGGELLHEYYKGEVNRPWIHPGKDPNLVLEFHQPPIKRKRNTYVRLFPSAELEMHRYNAKGKLLGVVTGTLKYNPAILEETEGYNFAIEEAIYALIRDGVLEPGAVDTYYRDAGLRNAIRKRIEEAVRLNEISQEPAP